MLDKKLALLMLKNGHSQAQIAKNFNVSRQRIHQFLTGYTSITALFNYKPKYKRHNNSKTNKLEIIYVELITRGCGVCRQKASAIHHIDKNFKNNDIKNLMAVCIKCHYEIHLGERTKKIIKLKLKPKIYWNKKYSECIICSTRKVSYRGYGLCSRCYQRYWHEMNKKKQIDSI